MRTLCVSSVMNRSFLSRCKGTFRRKPFCLRIAVCSLLSLLATACSVTTPIASLVPDEQMTTGSIPKSQTSVVDKLGVEDWRRAKSALGVALDPQSTGTPVKWDNPETKLSGSFVAAGNFVVQNDLVCRPFQATLLIKGSETRPSGLACRQGPNDWVIEEKVSYDVGKKQLQPGSLF